MFWQTGPGNLGHVSNFEVPTAQWPPSPHGGTWRQLTPVDTTDARPLGAGPWANHMAPIPQVFSGSDCRLVVPVPAASRTRTWRVRPAPAKSWNLIFLQLKILQSLPTLTLECAIVHFTFAWICQTTIPSGRADRESAARTNGSFCFIAEINCPTSKVSSTGGHL